MLEIVTSLLCWLSAFCSLLSALYFSSFDPNDPHHVRIRRERTGGISRAAIGVDVAESGDGGGCAGFALHIGVAIFDVCGAGEKVDVGRSATATAGDGVAAEELVVAVEVSQGLAIERAGGVADGLAVALDEVGGE